MHGQLLDPQGHATGHFGSPQLAGELGDEEAPLCPLQGICPPSPLVNQKSKRRCCELCMASQGCCYLCNLTLQERPGARVSWFGQQGTYAVPTGQRGSRDSRVESWDAACAQSLQHSEP